MFLELMGLTVIPFLCCFVQLCFEGSDKETLRWGGEIVHLLGVGQTTCTKQAQHYMGFSKRGKKNT